MQAPNVQSTGNARSEAALGQEFSSLSIGEPNQSYDASGGRRELNGHPNVISNSRPTGDGQYLGSEKGLPHQTQRSGIRLVNEDTSYQPQANPSSYDDWFPTSGKSPNVADVHKKYNHPAASPTSPHETSATRSSKGQVNLGRKTSIPRKEVGSSARHSPSQVEALSQVQKLADPTHSSVNSRHTTQAGQLEPQKTAGQHQSPSGSRKFEYSSQDVVKRAQNSSYDTEVIESMAPGTVIQIGI